MKLHVERVPEGLARKKVRYTVMVKSNDPKNEIMRLRVTAIAVRGKTR